MGGSASKSARQLPKSIPSAVRSVPEWAKPTDLPTEQPLPDRPASSPSASPPPPSTSTSTSASAAQPQSGQSSSRGGQDLLSHGRMESGSSMSREHQRGRQVGRAHANFSGDKDDSESYMTCRTPICSGPGLPTSSS